MVCSLTSIQCAQLEQVFFAIGGFLIDILFAGHILHVPWTLLIAVAILEVP